MSSEIQAQRRLGSCLNTMRHCVCAALMLIIVFALQGALHAQIIQTRSSAGSTSSVTNANVDDLKFTKDRQYLLHPSVSSSGNRTPRSRSNSQFRPVSAVAQQNRFAAPQTQLNAQPGTPQPVAPLNGAQTVPGTQQHIELTPSVPTQSFPQPSQQLALPPAFSPTPNRYGGPPLPETSLPSNPVLSPPIMNFPQAVQPQGNAMTFPGPQTFVPDPSSQQGEMVIPPSEVVPAEQVAQQPVFTFNFSEAPWEMVLRQFAEQFEMPLQISFQVEGSLTYFDGRSYTIPQAIDIFNDYLLPKGAILISHGGKLTVVGANNAIPDGFIRFVRLEELQSIGRNELATVAIPLQNVEPVSAVEEITGFLSPVGRVQPLTNSRRVVVTDTGAYLRRVYDLITGAGIASGRPTSVVYELRHADPELVAKAVNDFYSNQSGEGGAAQAVVVAEKTTKSIIIRDDSRGGEIYSLIQQLDRAPRQVLISALIVEVQLGKTDEFGVELGYQDSVLFDRSVIDNILTVTETATTAVGTQTTNQRIISQTAAPGFNFNNQPLGNNVAVRPSTVGSQALSSLGLGRVNGDLGVGGLVLSAGSQNVSALLRALDARFDVDILSRPQIRAVDNNEALIQIGQQVPVVDGVAVTANGSANPVIRQDQAGIILKVTPKISPESRVLIDVQAEKSAFQLAPGTGVPIFTDATNGNVIEAPVKDITTATTQVSVGTGQTVVLGGMITNEEIVVERKVPFLGDIPLIRHAFRTSLRDSERRELLIFLTPHVIHNDHESDQLNERMKSHVHIPGGAYEFEEVGGPPVIGGHSFGGEACTPEMPPAVVPEEF